MTTRFPELAAKGPAVFKYANMIRNPKKEPPSAYIDVPSLTLDLRKFAAMQIAQSTRDTAPRFCVIAGPPGVGKSNGALNVLLACGYAVAVISSSMLASEVEGGATETFNAMLGEFEQYSVQNKERVIAILDDFDLSIVARDDKTGISSNTNLLTERLQFLADNRHVYRNFDGTNIALVFTINNAEPLRASLLRDMRATWIEHNPDKATKANIAYRILDPQTAEERGLVDKLIRKYASQPIAFWKALRLDMDAARLDGLLANGLPPAHEVDAALAQRTPLDLARLEQLASKRSVSRIRNYLFNAR